MQKAITLYLGELKLKYNAAKYSLMAVKEKAGFDENRWEPTYGSTAEQLKQYDILSLPPQAAWVELRPGLMFQQTTTEDQADDKKQTSKKVVTMEFRATGSDGNKTIDDFVNEAYDWYMKKIEATEDKSRYMYVMTHKATSSSNDDDGGNSNDGERKYKRYKLSDAKTFESLFFGEKDNLLRILDHFQNKNGKYAIPGYPHKLGLLLHGPPGTGKTSLIKAIAHHTNRNIVSIPLSRISTNQELMDIVFDQSFMVHGEDMPVKLRFQDTVFVMEDVDAASPIVHAREGASSSSSGGSHVKITRQTSTIAEDKEAEGEKKEPTVVSQTTSTVDATLPGPALPMGMDDDAALMLGMLASSLEGKSKGLNFKSYASTTDKLDLAGLLNVLDGVVDTPNRILIMTTNHPEKLDPALIRPGRIDKKLYLGFIEFEQCAQMVNHYFQTTMTDEQREALRDVFSGPPGSAEFTPAEVEQYCAEAETVEEFIGMLNDHLKVVLPDMVLQPSKSVLN